VGTTGRKKIDLALWGKERLEYSKARRGRHERGAALGECALVAAMAQTMSVRTARPAEPKDALAAGKDAAA
jgi:hypothetical protein